MTMKLKKLDYNGSTGQILDAMHSVYSLRELADWLKFQSTASHTLPELKTIYSTLLPLINNEILKQVNNALLSFQYCVANNINVVEAE